MNRNSSNEFNNDEAFLSLLASQRQELQRLNMESATAEIPRQQLHRHQTIHASNSRKRPRTTMMQGRIINGPHDPMSLTNTPAPAYSNEDVHQSQRLMTDAFGGSEFFGMSAFQKYQQVGNAGLVEKFQERDGKFETNQRSNAGLTSSFLSLEHVNHATTPIPLTRRLSLPSSTGTIESGDDSFEADMDNIDSSSPILETTPKTKSISSSSVLAPPNTQLDPRIPRDVAYDNLSKFVTSMDESTKSQQAIHDWDRKMGLKRSHCKTMRSTMQSRKRLRRMLKKDINALARSRLPKKPQS
jgi:hypothetical protein